MPQPEFAVKELFAVCSHGTSAVDRPLAAETAISEVCALRHGQDGEFEFLMSEAADCSCQQPDHILYLFSQSFRTAIVFAAPCARLPGGTARRKWPRNSLISLNLRSENGTTLEVSNPQHLGVKPRPSVIPKPAGRNALTLRRRRGGPLTTS
jgi:hypothetical protein